MAMRSRGDEVNSVKYPQLDATHWHTVSMQILFTLALLPLCLSPSCSPYLALSLSLSPFRYRDPRRERERVPLRTLVLRSPLPPVPLSWKAKRRTTCAYPTFAPRVHTFPSSLPPPPPACVSHLAAKPHHALYTDLVILARA